MHKSSPLRPIPTLVRLLFAAVLALPFSALAATARIKDIVDVEGVRDNMLVGYGLVVGLNGTGDSLTASPFTEQSLQAMLERLGVSVRGQNLKTKNVAAVMVTATLPPFAVQGSRIDVTVSALGDAKDLLGGQLLVTPLMGADGEVYAISQGSVATGAVSASGAAASVVTGVPTTARIAAGAIVERELPYDLAGQNTLRLSLRNPDFTTAQRVATAINATLGGRAAIAQNPMTIQVNIPPAQQGDMVALLTKIEQLPVEPDQPARVVIDERTGIIVMGDQVRISTVAIAQGNLTIRITEAPQVSQPNALSQTGTTQIVQRSKVEVNKGDDQRLAVLSAGVTLQDLVASLNALGVGPRDMIAILQSIKAAGALQAEIEVM